MRLGPAAVKGGALAAVYGALVLLIACVADLGLRDIGTFLIIACAVGEILFCVFYSLLAPWWHTAAGRQMFAKSAVFGLVLAVWAIGAVTRAGDQHWFQVLRLCVFGLAPLAIWRQLFLLLDINKLAWRRTREGTRDDR